MLLCTSSLAVGQIYSVLVCSVVIEMRLSVWLRWKFKILCLKSEGIKGESRDSAIRHNVRTVYIHRSTVYGIHEFCIEI